MREIFWKGGEVGDFAAEKRQAKNQRELLCLSNYFLIGGDRLIQN